MPHLINSKSGFNPTRWLFATKWRSTFPQISYNFQKNVFRCLSTGRARVPVSVHVQESAAVWWVCQLCLVQFGKELNRRKFFQVEGWLGDQPLEAIKDRVWQRGEGCFGDVSAEASGEKKVSLNFNFRINIMLKWRVHLHEANRHTFPLGSSGIYRCNSFGERCSVLRTFLVKISVIFRK